MSEACDLRVMVVREPHGRGHRDRPTALVLGAISPSRSTTYTCLNLFPFFPPQLSQICYGQPG